MYYILEKKVRFLAHATYAFIYTHGDTKLINPSFLTALSIDSMFEPGKEQVSLVRLSESAGPNNYIGYAFIIGRGR